MLARLGFVIPGLGSRLNIYLSKVVQELAVLLGHLCRANSYLLRLRFEAKRKVVESGRLGALKPYGKADKCSEPRTGDLAVLPTHES